MPSPVPWIGAALLAIAPTTAAQVSGVARVAVDGAVGSFQEVPVATLRSANPGPSLSKPPNASAVDSRGRYYLALADAGEMPAVYSATGEFIAQLGRKGAGPGEFRSANGIAIDGADTVFVVDPATSRLTVLDPAYRYVRSVPIPGGAFAVVALPRLVVVNTAAPDDHSGGMPLHGFDPRGNAVFPELDRPKVPVGGADPLLRALAPSGDRHLWSATMFGPHRIERVDSRGRVVRTLELEGRWLRRQDQFRPGLPRGQPYSSIAAVREDGAGRLWVVLRIPDAKWRSGLAWPDASADRERRGTPIVKDHHRVFDCVIVVLDPTTAKVVASRRSDRVCDAMPMDGLVATLREDEDGAQVIDIARLTIARGR